MQLVRVALYGTSIMLAVVEAALRQSPRLALIRVDPAKCPPDELLAHFCPQLVIVDGNQAWPTNPTTLLLRIDANANNQAALLYNCTWPIQQLTDLVTLIEQSVGKLPTTYSGRDPEVTATGGVYSPFALHLPATV